MQLLPIGKYFNNCGEEGIRYAWSVDEINTYYVESGAFLRRTKLGEGTADESIRAYTASVSLGCILAKNAIQCKFCVTGNTIPFTRLLTAKEIAFQSIYMIIDDDMKDPSLFKREFAYMGQGEPGFSYENVKQAIIGTDKIAKVLGTSVYRHIFATSGVPEAISKLTQDYLKGDYKDANILLHLSVHSAQNRKELMPIDSKYPLGQVLSASIDFAKATNRKVAVNFLMLKNAILCGHGPFTTISEAQIKTLVSLLNPKYHRIILCEYNPSVLVCAKNTAITIEEISKLQIIIEKAGFEVKKFISFGREDKLACGLLGGKADPNIDPVLIKEKFARALSLVNEYVN